MPIPRCPSWKRYRNGTSCALCMRLHSSVQIYEDAEVKYAAIYKSISQVIEEAYSILYRNSHEIPDKPIGSTGTIFAINTIPGYPRQEVIAVPTSSHAEIRSCSAQISSQRDLSFVLIDAARKGEPMIGIPKGLYADVPRVTGGYLRDGRIGADGY